MARRTLDPTQRQIPERNEFKYRTIRRGVGHGLILDRVWAEQLKTHLGEQYRNNRETEATLKLTGLLEMFERNFRFMATREDYRKMIAKSEKLRWDKGFGLSKEDAVARFFESGKKQKISLSPRPSDLRATQDYPNYVPRTGSSIGKIHTRQIGADRVLKDFKKMLEAIFSIGDGAKKRANMPKLNVSRTVSKTIGKL